MADYDAVDTRKMTLSAASSEENFGKLCTSVILSNIEACFVDFDKPSDTGGIYLPANSGPTQLDLKFTRISARTAAGSGTLYVTGLR